MTAAASAQTREAVDALLKVAGVTQQRGLVRRIVEAGLGLSSDDASRLDLKISAAALEEMREAFALFAPYTGVRKATIFGSARTQPGDLLYTAAEASARALSDDNWMVVTGAGPGIMEAAAIGAGAEHSLGVSIRLPFEEEPNAFVANDERHVAMKYFFTRKLMLVKESSAFICLPGGFGTMDETFELLTLQQTGKMVPVPIVLLDRPGGTYWSGFKSFVLNELERGGFVTPGDLDRVLITDSADAAVGHVHGFWSNYTDLRWFPTNVPGERDTLLLYVRTAPTAAQLVELNERFGFMLAAGAIEIAEPYPEEGSERANLVRVRLVPRPHAIGELYRIIWALNEMAPGDPSTEE
ncbi:LOG family protein [Leucobacter aridicollis]|uniref:LOG family protein n=1 Tax=Leucobacter aridicollis TaxID=283878 RepID=UPI000E64F4F3|nr:LOG family protein [Leucobacter aridicollis]UTX54065.1 LOG family protein [Leucobacter aridicollis]